MKTTIAAAPQDVRVPRPATLRERRLRVLVVDDEASVRMLLDCVLASHGHQVWTACSGREGLDLLERQSVDLVLTDLEMPGMSGWEVARRVKQRWPCIKVGIVSGWAAPLAREALAARGVDFRYTKPFDVQDLLGTLSSL